VNVREWDTKRIANTGVVSQGFYALKRVLGVEQRTNHARVNDLLVVSKNLDTNSSQIAIWKASERRRYFMTPWRLMATRVSM
jgi:hypothetical protein